MKNLIVLYLVAYIACGFLVGCGKGKTPSSSSAAPSPEATGNAPSETPAAASPTPAPAGPALNSEADINAALSALTQAVRKYSAEKQRVPQSLNEVITAGYVPSPPIPPPGKKFAITRKLEVILVRE